VAGAHIVRGEHGCDLAREPVPHAVHLRNPGGRQQRTGKHAVARQRLEVRRATAQLRQVQVGIFRVRDEERGGARPRDLGKLRRARHTQHACRVRNGGARVRIRHRVPPAARHPAPQRMGIQRIVRRYRWLEWALHAAWVGGGVAL
jgi:hypothetical protein